MRFYQEGRDIGWQPVQVQGQVAVLVGAFQEEDHCYLEMIGLLPCGRTLGRDRYSWLPELLARLSFGGDCFWHLKEVPSDATSASPPCGRLYEATGGEQPSGVGAWLRVEIANGMFYLDDPLPEKGVSPIFEEEDILQVVCSDAMALYSRPRKRTSVRAEEILRAADMLAERHLSEEAFSDAWIATLLKDFSLLAACTDDGNGVMVICDVSLRLIVERVFCDFAKEMVSRLPGGPDRWVWSGPEARLVERPF